MIRYVHFVSVWFTFTIVVTGLATSTFLHASANPTPSKMSGIKTEGLSLTEILYLSP